MSFEKPLRNDIEAVESATKRHELE
jgi:hypothetical protein